MKPRRTTEAKRERRFESAAHKAAGVRELPRVIEVRIDELILRGFNDSDRHHVADAVQREIHRLLSEGGVSVDWHSDIAIRHVDAGEFAVDTDVTPARIGEQLAGSLIKGLGVAPGSAAHSAKGPSRLSLHVS